MKKVMFVSVVAAMLILLALTAVAESEVYTLREATTNCLVETIGGLTTASISKAQADEMVRSEEGEYIVIEEFDSKYDNTAILSNNSEGVVSVQMDMDDPWDCAQRTSGQRDLAKVKTFFKDGYLRSSKVRHGHTPGEYELGEYTRLFVKVFHVYDEENFRLVVVSDGNPTEYAKKATAAHSAVVTTIGDTQPQPTSNPQPHEDRPGEVVQVSGDRAHPTPGHNQETGYSANANAGTGSAGSAQHNEERYD